MTIFLTSSHTLGWAGPLNPANGLVSELRAALKRPINCVMISSFPDDIEITDRMAWEIRECFEWADLAFDNYEVLDRRTEDEAKQMIGNANFLVLCGGHVPTENKFFQELGLRQLLKNWNGVMLTVSAGSMNCADTVYSPPEMEGEAVDPDYQSYLQGLGLTDVNILPHFQQLSRAVIDGKKLITEIVAKDSYRHPVYCLPDGSYFKITPKETILFGKAYRIFDGKKKLICHDGERKLLSPSGRLTRLQ